MEGEIALHSLQEELAFQGDSLQRLNDALASQQQDLLLLRRQLELLGEEVRRLRAAHDAGLEGTAHATDDEKPPHY